jgi:large subunit ribosomal protein L23
MGIFDRFKQQEDADTTNAQAAAVKPSSPSSGKKVSDTKETPKKKEENKSSKKSVGLPDGLRGVILHPLVTEKAAELTSMSKYVFVVRTDANRIEVRNAVRKMYNVDPISVNIIKMRGKHVRFGRLRGQRKAWKKAIVSFPKGTSIDAYEGV